MYPAIEASLTLWSNNSGHVHVDLFLLEQNRAAAYLTAVTLTVYIWDLIISTPQELPLLRNYPLSLAQIVYIFARLSPLPEIILLLIFQVAPVTHCKAIFIAHGTVYIANAASSLLMLLRVRAVFSHSPSVAWSFTALWLSMLGYYLALICLARFDDVRAIPSPAGSGCLVVTIKPYTAQSVLVPMLYDTLVYLATSWRLVMWHVDFDAAKYSSCWARAKALCKGSPGVGRLSYVLLSTGQFYYLVVMSTGIAAVIMMQTYCPPLFTVATTLNFTICSIMACRVFRQLKLGIIVDSPTSPTQLLTPMTTPTDEQNESTLLS